MFSQERACSCSLSVGSDRATSETQNIRTAEDVLLFVCLFRAGGVSASELLQTFNCGIGAAVIVSPLDAEPVRQLITSEIAHTVGTVEVRSAEGEAVRM
jgi:phosphoribosylaminoimidazole (AIR) synthetase